jgi:Zn-dependent protease/predicted transcriptional regulator
MITQSVHLMTIRGIQVGVHYSWLIVFFLVTFSLTGQFVLQHPDWRRGEHITLAVATSLLFFGCILLHELAHSLVAQAKQIPVRSITLFVFGGVAQIGREPDRPLTEFQIAIAGPIASVLLGLGFDVMADLAGAHAPHVAALAGWLASINLFIAMFNLVPGFPLDGGRIFRAAMWAVTGSFARATRMASRSGQTVGFVMIIGGIAIAFTGNWVNGLWIAFIGWFLLDAAQQSGLQVAMRSALSGLVARDIMTRDCPTVSGRLSLAELVEDHILKTGQRCFVIADEGRLDGLITLHQIKTIPRERWQHTALSSVMTPLARLHVVAPDTPILKVLEVMEAGDVNQVPVISDHRLAGMISRDHVLGVLYARMELGRPSA